MKQVTDKATQVKCASTAVVEEPRVVEVIGNAVVKAKKVVRMIQYSRAGPF
jgi:hypothetical protein